MQLPLPFLSYSAKQLWRSSKQQYRNRYYLRIKSPQTPEMVFGHSIAKQLETQITDPILQRIVDSGALPLYPEREHRIEIEVHGVPLLGVIDMYDIDAHRFRDQKTGHPSPQGIPAWNQSKVDKHPQLAFYSMLVEKQHGSVDEVCHLDYLETKWKSAFEVFNGHVLEGVGDGLMLTGRCENFERVVTDTDRYAELEDTIQAAHEISADYQNFLKNV